MPSFSISNIDVSERELNYCYESAKLQYQYGMFDWTDLDIIFSIMLCNREYFPNVVLSGMLTPEAYMMQWVRQYYNAIGNLPSTRLAKPKNACSDPAIKLLVKETQRMSDSDATRSEMSHNLFMSAENIQGCLLEEYIARSIRKYGFIWCAGNILHAIDFCNTTGSFLLQIKNKSNTENSSSSAIREGTRIEKWYRLGTRMQNGMRVPNFQWEKLNQIVNLNESEGYEYGPCCMSEEDYQNFLINVAHCNSRIITNL